MSAKDMATLAAAPGVFKASHSGNGVADLFLQNACQVEFRLGVLGRFGCGSLPVAREVIDTGENQTRPFAITVGNYCETARSSILVGSEHQNAKAINTVFSRSRNLQMAAREEGVAFDMPVTRGPVHIGHGVIVSQHATILSGVTIGNGAVIGAGAVVTRDVPDYAIMAGSPARLLRYRFDEATQRLLNRIRWWDLLPSRLVALYALLQTVHESPEIEETLALKPEDYRKDNVDCWMFSRKGEPPDTPSFRLEGAYFDGRFHALKALPPLLGVYAEQARQPAGTAIFIAHDIFGIARNASPA